MEAQNNSRLTDSRARKKGPLAMLMVQMEEEMEEVEELMEEEMEG